MRKINNILVTGGAGFIGWNFCNLLLQDTQFNIINMDDLTYASKDKIFYMI
jgi:dTDP-glucose 4,6-dehydratase